MRHKRAPKRDIQPDGKYGRADIAKFINYIMKKGKKSTAESILYGAFERISDETKDDPLKVFDAAMQNVAPTLEVKSKRVGGANYQIPIPVSPDRRLVLASRWILEAARGRKGKPMAIKLADEFVLAAKGEGSAVKKKQDVHRMAEANRAFAHFARNR
ncbi:MAG: 30S ribosomal protein S7 [Patescibacteria group bacterium]